MAGIDKVSWQAVSTLLDELLEMPVAQRAARLAQVEKENPACAREAAALLSQQAAVESERFLESSPAESTELSTLAGRRIGEYVLERPIGTGGMGSVWLASRSDGHYERKAAIKFLNLFQLGDAAVGCLRREASALAKLSHANITNLIDAGVAAGQPYLVLEYVEGRRIDTWCDAQRLDVAGRIRLFLQVLAAVSHAHGRLVLHRDLKPSNILVTDEGSVKLLDFGVAKLLEDTGQAQPQAPITRLIGLALTPEYAAPEQMLNGELTAASDVYALGVLLYLLLVGAHPMPVMSTTSAKQVLALLEDEPQRASDAALSAGVAVAHARGVAPPQLARMLRGDLDNILAKSLKKQPAERYATVEAFADDLQRHLNDEPVSARPDSRVYRLRKFVRRYRVAVVATSATVLALATGAAVATWQAVEASRGREEARVQREDARYQSRRAEAANEFLYTLLMSDGGPGKPPLSSLDRLDLGVDLLEAHYREEPSFAGRMLVDLGVQYRNSTNPRRAVEVFDRAYELGRRSSDLELMALARCASALVEAAAETMAPADKLVEGQRLLESLPASGTNARVACLQASAWRSNRKGDDSTALADLSRARALLEQTGETHRVSYAFTLNMIGILHSDFGRSREALRMYDLAAEVHRTYGRDNTSAQLVVRQNRAVALYHAGELRQALGEHEKVNQRIRDFEPADRIPIFYSIYHARLLVRFERPREALDVLGDSAERARRAGHLFMLKGVLAVTGAAQLQLGLIGEAERTIEELEGLANGTGRATRQAIDHVAAQLHIARGDTAGARKRVEAALAPEGHPGAEPGLYTDDLLRLAADIALRERRSEDAERHARAALAVAQAAARDENSSADVGESLLWIAKALLAGGRAAEARRYLELAEQCFLSSLGEGHSLTRAVRAAREGEFTYWTLDM